ncbi:MAG: hypothetical protein DRG82_15440 [Deltaproteobacteria bacterium]|nr:MAG: hypothetical protein DRG82_15440 [Deltaproteobacteria bacterium]
MMKSGTKKLRIFVVGTLLVTVTLLLDTQLPAGSRLGKITGIIGEVIAVNLGRIHGVRQGLRGTVFKFDEQKQTVTVAKIQVIAVSENDCLARITELLDSLEVGQFVDIEGTLGPRTLEKVDLEKEMEENARNYFAAFQYTEPDSANCWAECRKILARNPNNRLALELKKQMIRNYFQWAEREKNDGNFAYAMIYYTRILVIDPESEQAYENLWALLDLIDVESEIPLGVIEKNRPPDYYYAIAEQYYRQGQFEKSKKYFDYLLKNYVQEDLVAREGIEKNDRMLKLMAELRRKRAEVARLAAQREQQKQESEQARRKKLAQVRYYRTVAEDLFRKKDYTGALVYYYRILDIIPDDSLAQARREQIAMADMVLIPAGEFSRGSSNREIGEIMVDFGSNNLLYRELPKKWVYLDSFYIDRYEVTNRQYKHFIESTGHSPPLHWKNGTYPEGEDNFPVVYVSWLEANAYARWIGKRLPTEAEWEKAARGSNGFQWPWGDEFYPHRCNVKETGKGRPMPVGSFLNGANEYGVMDLAGNVWEWVYDDLKPYPGYNRELYFFPSTVRKVIRGGSFKETGDYARGAFRGDGAVDQLYNNVGFRCARDLPGRAESPEG